MQRKENRKNGFKSFFLVLHGQRFGRHGDTKKKKTVYCTAVLNNHFSAFFCEYNIIKFTILIVSCKKLPAFSLYIVDISPYGLINPLSSKTNTFYFCSDLTFWSVRTFKDVRAHCYWASPLRTARACNVIHQAHAPSKKTQENIVFMAAALVWCENIFVGCMVTPLFSVDHFLFWFFPL